MIPIDAFNLAGIPLWALVVVAIWSLIWDGLALWKSAGKKQPVWFVVMLLTNTLGILEILYLFVFSKWSSKKKLKRK